MGLIIAGVCGVYLLWWAVWGEKPRNWFWSDSPEGDWEKPAEVEPEPAGTPAQHVIPRTTELRAIAFTDEDIRDWEART